MMMFLFRKCITCSVTSTCFEKIPIAVPPPSFTFPFSLLSSSPTPNNNNVISEWLLNEGGFCPFEVTKIMRRSAPLLRTRSARTAKEAVQFLRDSGFTQDQLKKTIVGCPSILRLKVDGQLKLKLEFLKTIGLTDQELRNLISKAPRFITYSLENNICPTISYLESLFGSKINLAKALKRAPSLINSNIEKQLTAKVDLLKHYGSIQGELLSQLISLRPNILNRFSSETLKSKIEYVNNMGFLQGSKSFIYALGIVICNTPNNLERKMKHMASFGILEEEIQVVIRKFPDVLKFSTKKLQENMDFFIHTARLPPTIVVTYPSLFCLSLKKRLEPRYEVFKALSSMKQTQHLPSLVSMFLLSEQKFIQKFVECDPEASVLKGIYKGDSANLTIT